MKEKRGPWFLLTGLAAGLAAGVLFSWLVAPVQFMDTDQASLHPDFRSEYRALIAQAYLSDGDIGRAQGRLALLGDKNPVVELDNQSRQAQEAERPQREVEALAALSAGLKSYQAPEVELEPPQITFAPAINETPLNLEPTSTPEQGMMILTPTPTLLATTTPRPSLTPRAILRVPFVLSEKQEVCDPEQPEGLLQIEVLDSAGKPVAGVKAVITWDGGENSFYTGLNPRVSPGYADFMMDSETVYSLRVGEGGETVSKLEPVQCQAGDTQVEDGVAATPEVAYRGGWRLRFVEQ